MFERNRAGANRSEKQKERGGERRDSPGRVRAEVLGGRSKAVISW